MPRPIMPVFDQGGHNWWGELAKADAELLKEIVLESQCRLKNLLRRLLAKLISVDVSRTDCKLY